MGVRRTGSNRSPARCPAKVPNVTGVIGRAERRQADLGHRPVERAGRDREPVHVRRLALVGRHAGGGVALDVLDRAHALAHGELDVLGRHVVLEVDEGLHLLRVARMRHGAMETAGGRDRRRRPRRRARSARPQQRRRRDGPRRARRRDRKSPLQAPTELSAWAGAPGTIDFAVARRSRACRAIARRDAPPASSRPPSGRDRRRPGPGVPRLGTERASCAEQTRSAARRRRLRRSPAATAQAGRPRGHGQGPRRRAHDRRSPRFPPPPRCRSSAARIAAIVGGDMTTTRRPALTP